MELGDRIPGEDIGVTVKPCPDCWCHLIFQGPDGRVDLDGPMVIQLAWTLAKLPPPPPELIQLTADGVREDDGE
jgi:hypothetical protein